ncbi:LysR substrate-binding domain-containing protein [Kiloniella laminariae]|uniref:LysR substrate-binding domain-containing protein n=1 Tax=Kiloniella laminariae TaxID=454162 RepID=A0ABT4LJ87_9PROT|nr:LysR substrate-binding domain-containing protein [Kiloniella laminariae]MCZ4280426.1 LysR substrate-binding domain-containing protein [Kiloniella laminariae]
MRTPNLNSLRMFDAAARHLNFRLAAEELNLTQGAVAQQVRRLESDLGQQLFHRKARGLALTDVGHDYHQPVRQALAILDEATQKLRPESSRVTLSMTPSFAAKWLVPRLSSFELKHPDIEVQTVASESLANFRSDGVDLAIRLGSPPFAPELDVIPLALMELCAVCSPAYASGLAEIKTFQDFAKHRLIQDSHNQWDRFWERSGVKTDYRKVQFNQTALAMDAAINGQGIALVPHLLIEQDVAQGKLVELWRDRQEPQPGYYIVSPQARPHTQAQKKIINWLLQEVGTAASTS